MDEPIKYGVIVTKKGQQIPFSAAEGLTVSVGIPGDKMKETVILDVGTDEFANLQELAVANNIPADILKPKEAPEEDVGQEDSI